MRSNRNARLECTVVATCYNMPSQQSMRKTCRALAASFAHFVLHALHYFWLLPLISCNEITFNFSDWILNFKCSFGAGALTWPLKLMCACSWSYVMTLGYCQDMLRKGSRLTFLYVHHCVHVCAHMHMQHVHKLKNLCGREGGWSTPSSPQFQALKWHNNNNNNTCATLVPFAPDRIDCCVLVHMASICFMQTSCWGSREFNLALRKLRAPCKENTCSSSYSW